MLRGELIPEFAMKTILKQMMLMQAVLLLVVVSGPAQVLSPVYSFNTNDAVAQTEGLLLSGNTLYGTASRIFSFSALRVIHIC